MVGRLPPWGVSRISSAELEAHFVGGLEAAKIIYKSATVGTVFDGWDYNLQTWAWDYLNEHPQLVGLCL